MGFASLGSERSPRWVGLLSGARGAYVLGLAGPSIIPLRIGEARPVAGVIHSRLVLSPSGVGFSPPYEISYRGVKLPRVSAALRPLLRAALGRFAAGGLPCY